MQAEVSIASNTIKDSLASQTLTGERESGDTAIVELCSGPHKPGEC